jgi:hypothetical protein
VFASNYKGCELPRLDVIALRTEQPEGEPSAGCLTSPGAQVSERPAEICRLPCNAVMSPIKPRT